MKTVELHGVSVSVPDHWEHRATVQGGDGYEMVDGLALLDTETGAFMKLSLTLYPHFHESYKGQVWRHFPEALAT